MNDQTCTTCGDRNGHSGLPSAVVACAARVHLIEALQTYTEGIDGHAPDGTRFIDLFAAVANRCGADVFTVARICEAVIGLGWRPKVGA